MKKLLILIMLLISMVAIGQDPILIKLRQDQINTALDGTVIDRGDEFELIVDANGNGNTTTRHILFDLEYDYSNFELISVNHTGTEGNGGILPYGSNIQMTWHNYPGVSWVSTVLNNTMNGTQNYQNANYKGTAEKAITRIDLVWATTQGMPYNEYDRLLVLRFRLRPNSTSYFFDPIKLNFAATWNKNGMYESANNMMFPTASQIVMNQNANKLATAHVDVNSNLLNLTNVKVMFRDTLSNIGYLFDVLEDGTVDINQTQLAENRVYNVQVMYEMDKLYSIYNSAITISDFTTSQSEFITMGLDGSNGSILQTGQSLYAADINRNRAIDGGDLPKLLAQAVGVDTLIMLPPQYSVGSGGWMSIPTWDVNAWDNITTFNWKDIIYPKTYIKTSTLGNIQSIDLKYLLWGDVNRSHSSQVVTMINGVPTIRTNAVKSLQTNKAFKSMGYINTPYNINSIDVSLNNVTVVSNSIEIPVTINTNGANVSGLQFQFDYDPTKLKFEELASTLPNTWYVFANSKDGKVKFGALDQNNKTPINGVNIPFKLKFSTIGSGVDILTSIKVSPTMDASSTNGTQLGINLNTTQIKLTGYNNF